MQDATSVRETGKEREEWEIPYYQTGNPWSGYRYGLQNAKAPTWMIVTGSDRCLITVQLRLIVKCTCIPDAIIFGL